MDMYIIVHDDRSYVILYMYRCRYCLNKNKNRNFIISNELKSKT